MRKLVIIISMFLLVSCHSGESYDKLKAKNDSLNTALISANFKLTRIQYYVDITNADATKKKYFFGWIRVLFPDKTLQKKKIKK